jgi:hypothetical protein
MKAYGGVDVVYIHFFLTLALAGGEWSASRLDCSNPVERAIGTHCVGGWLDPRAGLDGVEMRQFLTVPGLEIRPLGHPARSQSLYRLSYPSSYILLSFFIIFNGKFEFVNLTMRHIT